MTADPGGQAPSFFIASLPYGCLAILVIPGLQLGLKLVGRAYGRSRSTLLAVAGLASAVWCLAAGWAGVVGFHMEAARPVGDATVAGTTRWLSATPTPVAALADLSRWTLVLASLGAITTALAFSSLLPRHLRARRRAYVED